MPHVPATPLATYRLQFTPRFGFNDARAIVPYLAALGVDFIYASPYLKARPGSEHGYDVVDPNRLNPEIGTPEEHAAFIATAQAAGLGHLLDFVPNHMGIGVENPWWQDVLEWGEASPYGTYFDIDWRPLREEMRGRVLVPALGDYYGRALERGELMPTFDSKTGAFTVTISITPFRSRPRRTAICSRLRPRNTARAKRGRYARSRRSSRPPIGRVRSNSKPNSRARSRATMHRE